MVVERVLRFIRDCGFSGSGFSGSSFSGPGPSDPEIPRASGAPGLSNEARDPTALRRRFDELALEAFAFQFERSPVYRRLCERRRARPGAVTDWRRVPAVPAIAFKEGIDLVPDGVDLDDALTFRSSGTSTGGETRSVHVQPFPELYRATLDGAFPHYCLAGLPRPVPMLSLIPPRERLPDSSLSFMVDHGARRFGGEVAWAFGTREPQTTGSGSPGSGSPGLDAATAETWAEERIARGEPGLVLTTAFALLQWLDALAAAGHRLPLPAGTVIFETGGFKGRTREITRTELLARVEEHLAVPAHRVVREYGMTELTSQLYTTVLAGGDPDLFVAPPWARVRILDPATLEEAAPGQPGLVAIFDLANLGSAVHLLTEDLGIWGATEVDADRGGIRLLGRAAGSELRGCSLTAEEMGGIALDEDSKDEPEHPPT